MNFRPNLTKAKKTNSQNIHDAASNTVKNYMTTSLITFKPEQDIRDAIDVLLKRKISGAPVVDNEGTLVGVLSEKDCLRVIVDSVYNNMPAKKVEDYMSKKVETVLEDKSIVEVAQLFLKTPFRRFPVVNYKGELVGQVSRVDALRSVNSLSSNTWQNH